MAEIELPRRISGGGGGRRAVAAPTAADVQQVRIARDPGVRASPAAFGAGTGEGLQQAASGLADFGASTARISTELAAKKRDAQVDSSTAQAAEDLQTFTLGLERDPDYRTYSERFDARSAELFEQYSEGLDADGVTEFKRRFQRMSLESAGHVKRLNNARVVDAGVADLNTALSSYAQIAGRARTPEEFDEANVLAGLAVDKAVQDGFLTEAAGGTKKRGFHEQTDEISAMQAMAADPASAAKMLADPEVFSNLDEKRRLGLLKEAKTQARIEANERERVRKEQQALLRGRVSSALRDELASIRRTGQGQGLVGEDQIRAAYEPDQADAILQQMDEEQAFYETRQQIAVTPLSEDMAILEANAPAGEGFEVEAERQDLLIKAVKEKREALASDPVGYLFRVSPGFAQAFQAAGSPQDMRAVIDTMLAEQERIGVPRAISRALSKGQADQMVADYAGQQDAQGRADWVRAQADAYGEHWPKVYGEMVSSGLPGGAMVLAGMTGPGQTRGAQALAEAQQEGGKALKDAIGTETAGDVDDAVRSELTAFDRTMALTPGGGAIANLYRDQITALAYLYARQGADPSSAGTRAAADVINSQYSFHGTYRVPAGVDAAMVEERVTHYQETRLGLLDLALPPSLDELLGEEEIKRQYVSNLASYGYWVTNQDETGLLLFDQQGRTVMERVASKPVSEANLKRLNMTPEERRIVDYHRNTIETGTTGRDEQGRPITVFALGPRIPEGPFKGKFASVPGWVDGRILNEDEAYFHWKEEIDAGKWPIYDSGDELNRRARQIHSVMDAESGQREPVEILFSEVGRLADPAPPLPTSIEEGAVP